MLAERGGFEPDRARSVKKTRRWRVFSGARSALAADRVNFERSSKFGHPPSFEHTLDASPRLNHRSGPSADRAAVSQMRAERDPDRVNFERSSKFGYPSPCSKRLPTEPLFVLKHPRDQHVRDAHEMVLVFAAVVACPPHANQTHDAARNEIGGGVQKIELILAGSEL